MQVKHVTEGTAKGRIGCLCRVEGQGARDARIHTFTVSCASCQVEFRFII